MLNRLLITNIMIRVGTWAHQGCKRTICRIFFLQQHNHCRAVQIQKAYLLIFVGSTLPHAQACTDIVYNFTLAWSDINVLLLPNLTIVHAKRLMSITITAFVCISLVDWLLNLNTHSPKDALNLQSLVRCVCVHHREFVYMQSWGPYTHGCVRCQCYYISMLGTVAHLYKLAPWWSTKLPLKVASSKWA